MKDRFYAVTDVETTGNGIHGNRITEICIVLLKNDKIIEKFKSLINPERFIPSFITGLTGIDNALVEEAPKFYEIADEIDRITKNAVFVAHNVNFDYNVIRNEFKNVGINFQRKKLCTVRLSRKLIPGLYSYSLGRLCSALKIPLSDRHRAEGDTDATVLLFQKILDLDTDLATINGFLNARSKEATLPPHLEKANIDKLPEATGIYLFMDKKGKIIYAGKALNIKQRVISHFYDKKNSEYLLGQQTHTIDYEVTGSELIALLLESEKIAQHYPLYNKAQKNAPQPYNIVSYINQKGVIQLALTRNKNIYNVHDYFFTREKGIEKLEELCLTYNLCPRFCGLQSSTERCSHYKITTCLGVCVGDELIEDYNNRVKKACKELLNNRKDYVIKHEGRTPDEYAFILIRDNIYQGYGFINKEEQIEAIDDFEPFLIR
ncbi:MAG: exonuclease domain-containing protein, partial [Leeuwenhoekiella sp.]